MKKLLSIIVAVLMISAANAETGGESQVSHENSPLARKKVGVVLSGGGAKGMAHIGVLKVLEKAGIPVDIVTGTSIGSIVGGLYAITNDLKIPFACVATNIMDNSEIVFHSGRLPQAIRASMSIPAAFSPVRIGDMVLVDGGLKNNYPVDVAREMGADIVIGVTLNGKPKKAEDIRGTMKIVGQIIDVNCVNKYDENKAITDLWMNVDPHGYSTASFTSEAIDSLIRYGEEEAMRHWDEIIALKQRIGIDDSFRPTIHHPLKPNAMTERQRVVGFSFENMTSQAERFLRQKFHLSKVDSIDAQMEQELTTSMRMDLFYQTAECQLLPQGDGVRVILMAGNRKSMQFHAGVRYDTEENAALQLGIDIPLKTAVPVETDITLRLGKRLMARGEITVHPRSFTRPTFSYTFRRNDIDAYSHGDLDYNIRYNQLQAELLPINFDLRHFNLQMGMRWDYFHYRNQLGSETARQVSLENEHFFSYRARLAFNSEDDWNFPTRGARFNAEYAYVTNDFAKLDVLDADGKKQGKAMGMSDVSADWRMSFSFNSRFTIQPMLYGRLLFGSVVAAGLGNTIGSEWFGHYIEKQMPFAGIGNLEYVNHHFLAAQLQAQQRIGKNNYLQLRVSAAQQAAMLKELLDYRTMIGVQGAYYYNTMFGPVGATLGYSNYTKKAYFFINLGYEF